MVVSITVTRSSLIRCVTCPKSTISDYPQCPVPHQRRNKTTTRIFSWSVQQESSSPHLWSCTVGTLSFCVTYTSIFYTSTSFRPVRVDGHGVPEWDTGFCNQGRDPQKKCGGSAPPPPRRYTRTKCVENENQEETHTEDHSGSFSRMETKTLPLFHHFTSSNTHKRGYLQCKTMELNLLWKDK